jgi:hypothetical protein
MEVSKTVRTIKLPETDILPYLLVKKGLPSLFSHKDELVLGNKSHLQHQSDGRIYDFANILSKITPCTQWSNLTKLDSVQHQDKSDYTNAVNYWIFTCY